MRFGARFNAALRSPYIVRMGLLALATCLTIVSTSIATAQIIMPQVSHTAPVTITAPTAYRWQQGSREIWHLRGGCRIEQGARDAAATEALLWIDRPASGTRGATTVTAYLEGKVVVSQGRSGAAHARIGTTNDQVQAKTFLMDFKSAAGPQMRIGRVDPAPRVPPSIYQRAERRRSGDQRTIVRRTQFAPGEVPPANFPAAGKRRFRAFPRSSTPWNISADRNQANGEWVVVIDGGVNMIIDGVGNFGSIDVSTDRMVIWTTGGQMPDVAGQRLQDAREPLEIYMEGNVVFRQGERTIYADRFYYDVRNSQGTILNAEVVSPAPDVEGLIRIKSQVIQRLDEDHFAAHDAMVTTSQFGVPGYWGQAGNMTYEHRQVPSVDPFSGQPVIDPHTGEQIVDHEHWITSNQNFVYLEGVPVFYWPTLAMDATDPTFYIDRIRLGNDDVFGNQIYTDWNTYELLGVRNRIAGTEWGTSLDYLSKRGIAGGMNFGYDRHNLLGFEGPYRGFADAWFVPDDQGDDNLGRDRRSITPDETFRGRVLWQHRHLLENNFQLTAQAGWISDRNFLEQYFEKEWDQFKDQTTDIELKQLLDNQSWSIFASTRVNDFFTETEWLPRFDHFLPGYSLLDDRLTAYSHFSAGYGRLKIEEPSTNPQEPEQTLLPWEVAGSGERISLRGEIDLPLDLGPVKVVPYLLGEATHWGEVIGGDDMQRTVGQVGVRASLPMWSVDPNAESHLFNVHGMAHKVVFDMDFSFTEASQDVTDLPLYDQLDDNNIEHFRRRFLFDRFGTVMTPLTEAEAKVDERFYAIRNGLGNWVSSPSTETIDDLTALRFGVRQRWQTKRGMPGQRRIVDYIILDTRAVIFPKIEENFDEAIGLISYDWRWHVGDRTTLVSDGLFDIFDDGQRVFRIGGFLNRPPKGSLYMGLRSYNGPFNSNVASSSFTYQISEKWLTTYGGSVEISGNNNIGQHFSFTRVGESLLVTLGLNVDASKGNVGLGLTVVPRAFAGSPGGPYNGAQIPPPQAF